MEKLKRSLSFRKKKDHVPECSKPHQWQEDERKVRDGTCSFQVRYLGCIEVFESRGMQVCEEAVRALKARKSRSVWARMSLRRRKKKKDTDQQCKGKYQRAILYVSGDALRVVDEISKGLIVDQTIEKVSFCAPDRNHEKGFAYICRDGTTRRWMCHGFLALKESGERLSHAVGCAFAICLEKKQKREKDAVQVQYNDKGTSFTRTGSFRQATITERLQDPQIAMVPEPIQASNGGRPNPFASPNTEPVPMMKAENPNAVPRPHATDAMLQRQGSFRGFEKLQDSSPFKRQLSLRLNDLPSTLERHRDMSLQNPSFNANGPGTVSPIAEASPTKEQGETISQLCQEVTQGLTALSSDDPFANVPRGGAAAGAHANPQPAAGAMGGSGAAMPTAQAAQPSPQAPVYTTTVQGRNIPLAAPIRQNNPWASPPPTAGGAKVSDAEFWLNTTATQLAQHQHQHHAVHQQQPHPQQQMVPPGGMVNGSAAVQGEPFSPPAGQVAINPAVRAPHLSHLRSHSIDTAEMHSWQGSHARAPTLRELSSRGQVAQFQSQQNGAVSATSSTVWSSSVPNSTSSGPDPFDAAWAEKGSKTNPFQAGDNVTKAFEVKL